MRFEVKHPAHYQQYFHNVSCSCARIYGHSISCTQVANRHFWLTSDIVSIIDHISVVSVHTAWIWYTIARTHGVIRQKTYCELHGEPRTKARVHGIFGECQSLGTSSPLFYLQLNRGSFESKYNYLNY